MELDPRAVAVDGDDPGEACPGQERRGGQVDRGPMENERSAADAGDQPAARQGDRAQLEGGDGRRGDPAVAQGAESYEEGEQGQEGPVVDPGLGGAPGGRWTRSDQRAAVGLVFASLGARPYRR